MPEWDFKLQFTHYNDNLLDDNGTYTATSVYVKRRLKENVAGTSGYAVVAGVFPIIANRVRVWRHSRRRLP